MIGRRTIGVFLIGVAMAVTGCSDADVDDRANGWKVEDDAGNNSRVAERVPELAEGTTFEQTSPSEEPFVVHEWGTFTSVQTADGHNLSGLHHEEEALPPFFYDVARDDMGLMSVLKGILSLPGPVTQKLETPVLYFYGAPDTARVDVSFPEGLITEWYPQNSTFGPGSNPIDIRDGFMSWDVELSASADVVEVPEDDIWAPSRQVPDAKFVTSRGESDRFIFYRGLGRFEMPFETRLDDRGRYTLANESSQRVPHAFVLEVRGETGHIYDVGGVDGFSEQHFMPAPKEMPKPLDVMVEEAKTKVSAALVDTGLTRDEADAMVNTWERSYFKKPGQRVLYVVPREWTDELLPIKVEPQPDELVRTLVGRIDIVTPQEERAMVERIERSHELGDQARFFQAPDRFIEPRVRAACRRIERRDDAAQLSSWCRSVAQKLTHHMPSLEEQAQ